MDPIDRSERLTEIAFVNALVQLMTASERYRDVDPQALRGGRVQARVVPDISAQRDGRLIVVECKGAAPAIRSRIQRYERQLAALREAHPDAALVLAVPEELQPSYGDLFRARGIELWDPPYIASEFAPYLHLVTDERFRQLFFGAQGRGPLQQPPDDLRLRLQQIPCGAADWSRYQKLCVDLLEHLFVPPLGNPIYELADEPRINRRDIILPNYCDHGFWHYVRQRFVADYIVVDAKNYCQKVKKREGLQVANYLKHHGAGTFGIIFSRVGPARDALLIRREQWTLYGKMILFITDTDVGQMLTFRSSGTEPERVLRQKIEEFRLGV